MRPRVVIAVLVLASCFLGLAVLLSKVLVPQSPPPAQTAEVSAAGDPVSNAHPIQMETSARTNVFHNQVELAGPRFADMTQSIPATSNVLSPNAMDREQAKRIHKRVLELYALAMNDDTASRDAILSEFKNPEKNIRQAALEAAIQFGDRSVVPYLREAAAQTEDPREKVAILDAIDYINLPSLTEYAAQRKALGLTAAPPSTNFLRKPHSPRQQTPSLPVSP